MLWFVTLFACNNIEKSQESYIDELCTFYSDCNLLESYDYRTMEDCQNQLQAVPLTDDLDTLEQCISSLQESDCDAAVNHADITESCAGVLLSSE